MKKLRVAQIGIGHDHAYNAFDTLKKCSDIFALVALAIPEDEKVDYADRLPLFTGVPVQTAEEILARTDLDAIVIESEDPKLTKYALMAAKAGFPIQMDKPGGTDVRDFEALISIVKEKHLPFQTGYMYRHNPVITKAIADARAGKLGTITTVEAQMNCIHPAKKRQWLEKLPGGMMFFLGCHLIDIIVQIQGVPETITPFNTCSGLDGVTADDMGFAVLGYKNGFSFAKTTAVEKGGYDRRQLVIVGSDKTLEVRPLEMSTPEAPTALFSEMTEFTQESWIDRGTHSVSDTFDRYEAMFRAFAAFVRGERENPFTPDYELQLNKILMAACGVDVDWKHPAV